MGPSRTRVPPANRAAAGRRSGGAGLPIIDLPSDSGRSGPRVPGDSDEPVCPPSSPAKNSTPPPSAGASAVPEPSDRHIARIVLNKQLTGGFSHVEGGNGGVTVVFEPRNARGEMVAEPGDVSIALVDPAHGPGGAASPAGISPPATPSSSSVVPGQSVAATSSSFPGPSAAPQNKNLQLFVRYVTPDGRKLISQMTINIDPPRVAGRWRMATPSADRDPSDASPPAGRRSRLLSARSATRTAPCATAKRPASAARTPASTRPPALPKIERDSDADEDDDSPVSRRRSDDRQSSRPTWSPYR